MMQVKNNIKILALMATIIMVSVLPISASAYDSKNEKSDLISVNEFSMWGVVRHYDGSKDIYLNGVLADRAYIYLAFGGNMTENHHYKFLVYYDVEDMDHDYYDDEHVLFYTNWSYGKQITGSGGGGGGHAQPEDLNSIFTPISFHGYRPQDGEGGTDIYVTICWENIGISFRLYRVGGWSAYDEYSTDGNGNPYAILYQETGWIHGADAGLHTGAHLTETDRCYWIGGELWGPRLYLSVGVYHDEDPYGWKIVEWNIPAGLLALGIIRENGT